MLGELGPRVAGCAVLSALALAACSSPAPKAAPVAAQTLPPGCASALAALPASAPATGQQAADDATLLGGRKGNVADSLTDAVSADALRISFDLSMGGNTGADLSAWTKDVAALRAYCR